MVVHSQGCRTTLRSVKINFKQQLFRLISPVFKISKYSHNIIVLKQWKMLLTSIHYSHAVFEVHRQNHGVCIRHYLMSQLKNHCSALPKVVRQEFVGEVGTYIFFRCQVFWTGYICWSHLIAGEIKLIKRSESLCRAWCLNQTIEILILLWNPVPMALQLACRFLSQHGFVYKFRSDWFMFQ